MKSVLNIQNVKPFGRLELTANKVELLHITSPKLSTFIALKLMWIPTYVENFLADSVATLSNKRGYLLQLCRPSDSDYHCYIEPSEHLDDFSLIYVIDANHDRYIYPVKLVLVDDTKLSDNNLDAK